MKCSCGSESLYQTEFRSQVEHTIVLNTLDLGYVSEGLLLPELWVCTECRRLNMFIPEEEMLRVAPKS